MIRRSMLALLLTVIVTAATAAAAAELEVVAQLEQPPGNVAVTPQGTVIFSQHQFFDPRYRVMHLRDDGSPAPFPNEAWATPPGPDGRGLHAVLGVVADQRGRVWMLDNGAPQPRVVAWDTREDRLHRVITLPDHAAPEGSFPNDAAVDLAREKLYLADFGGPQPALIVVDLATGHARRVLAGHRSVTPEDVHIVIDGRTVTTGVGDQASAARIGVNPIAMDPSNTWVYFGAMNGTQVYRIPAAALADPDNDHGDLAAKIQAYGRKPVSDGITVDTAGNVYITDLEGKAIGITHPDGRYTRLIEDPRLQWPDGFAMGPDGYTYVSVNQLHRAPFLNRGENTARPPYYILRFRPESAAVVGR